MFQGKRKEIRDAGAKFWDSSPIEQLEKNDAFRKKLTQFYESGAYRKYELK